MKSSIATFIIVLFLSLGENINAQVNSHILLKDSPEFEELKGRIEQFFQYMHDGNIEGLNAMMEADIRFTSMNYMKSDVGRKYVINKEEFLDQVSRMQGIQWEEILEHYTMNMDKDYANVFIPYTFILDNVKTHCGVNNFQMINSPEGWKIHSVFDTRRVCTVK